MSVLKNSKYRKEILAINKLLKKEGLLKMDCEVIKPKTFKLFLIELIDNYVNYYFTLDAKNNCVTCGKAKHRSIMDLYKISKFYYPTLSFHKLFYTLCELNKEKKIRSLRCGDIEKIVCFTNNPLFNKKNSDFTILNYYNVEIIDNTLNLNYIQLKEIYEEYAKNK